MNKKNIAIILAIVIILGAGVFFVNSLYWDNDFDGGNVNSFDNNPALNDTNISDNNISGSNNKIKQNNQKTNPVNSKRDVKNNNNKNNNSNIDQNKLLTKKEAYEIAKKAFTEDNPGDNSYIISYSKAKYYDEGDLKYWKFPIYDKNTKHFGPYIIVDVETGGNWGENAERF